MVGFSDYWQEADPSAQPYLSQLLGLNQRSNPFSAGAQGPQLPMGAGLSPATGYGYPAPPSAAPQASQSSGSGGAGLGSLLGSALPLLGSLGGEFGLATGTDASGGVSNIGGAGMSHTGGGSTGNQILGTALQLAPLLLMFL